MMSKLSDGYERPYAKVLAKRLRERRRLIQAVAGPRQVGKTMLVHQVLTEWGSRIYYASAADLLMMDPKVFRTKAVFQDPERYPEGLKKVLINGVPAVEDGRVVPETQAGPMLRKNAQ